MQRLASLLLALALAASWSVTLEFASADNANNVWESSLDVYPGESIQQAINLAQPGDTIFVHSGAYHENIVVNRPVSIVGENSNTTTIYSTEVGGPGVSKIVIEIAANGVTIKGFTLTFPEGGWNNWAIFGIRVSNLTIAENIVKNCTHGIYLVNFSEDNTIRGNLIVNNSAIGISLDNSGGNRIFENTLQNNGEFGIHIQGSLQRRNSTVYHNNFLNRDQVLIYDPNNVVFDVWDSGSPSGGNYWSDGIHVDTHGDGLVDTPRVIDADNIDHYPLMSPYWYWKNPIDGDINRDMRVDIKDLAIPAKGYGTYPGDPNWNPYADLNEDNRIDIKDLALIARNYGKTYT